MVLMILKINRKGIFFSFFIKQISASTEHVETSSASISLLCKLSGGAVVVCNWAVSFEYVTEYFLC